jgi:hypothetical protein
MTRTLFVLGTVVVAACGSSSTAPKPPALVLSVAGPGTVQGHDTTISGNASYVCYYRLTVTASGGSPGEVATWGGGHETFTLASNGQVSSKVIAAANAFFGGDLSVPAGTQVVGNDFSWWVGPFSHSLTFYYGTPQVAIDSATVSFSCA